MSDAAAPGREPAAIPPVVWGIVALGAVLRLLGPLDSGLWFDEIWTLVDLGRLPLADVLTTYGSDNNHPLYTLAAWTSLHTLGESALALRLPAVLFGVASIAAQWMLARAVTGRREALLATALMALSYHHVWFSQNARGYTALLFFTLVSTTFFLRLLDERSGKAWIGYGLSLALGTFTHQTAVFVAAAHVLVYAGVTSRRRAAGDEDALSFRQPLYGLALATAVSLVLHVAILEEMITFMADKPAEREVTSSWNSPWWMVTAAAESLGMGVGVGLTLLGGALTVLAVGAVDYGRRSFRTLALFALPGLLGAVVMVGMGRNLWPRFFFFLAGFLLLIAVRGVMVIVGRICRLAPFARIPRIEFRAFVAVLVAAVLGGAITLPRAYGLPKQDFEGALAFVAETRTDRDVVVVLGLARKPYERYYEADCVPVETAAEFDAAIAGGKSALVLHTLPTYLESRRPDLHRLLEERAQEIARFRGSVGGGDVVVLRVAAQR